MKNYQIGLGLAMAGVAKAYDFYLFSQFWAPGECDQVYPGCTAPLDYWQANLTAHGLWPENYNGTWPEFCTTEPLDDAVIEKLGYEMMVTVWPNVLEPLGSENYDSFWEHEWTKHGTCTPFNQYDFFTHALDVYNNLGTPSFVPSNAGKTVALTDLKNAFGGADMAAILCQDGINFSEVRTCWEYDPATLIPSKRISCPAPIVEETTCPENVGIKAKCN